MGAILSLLKTVAQDRPTCPLLNTSLSKIRDYHAAFTSLCDNFSINIAEFDQIFSSLHINSFSIWDTDDNGYIDALELFSGLVVFADSKFKDKIRFIFDLFDFNEIGEILTVDLQFLVLCCLNSTFKIYGANPKIDHEEVISFINSYFAEDTLISLERIIKWCHNSEEISTFFGTIKKDPPGIKLTNAPIQFDAFKKFGEKRKRKLPTLSRKTGEVKPVSEIFNSQKFKTKLDYLTSIISKGPLPSAQLNSHIKVKDSIAKMKWVYGFRCNDVKHPLRFIGGRANRIKSERLVYISGCVVIVYFSKANEQNHYVEHEKEVISLAVSPGGLVASGELGEKPAIHVWDSDTLQNVAVLKGIHSKGVNLLCFIKQNDLLASCGVRIDSPLLVYNVNDGTLVLSTRLKGYALDLQIAKPYLWDPEEKDFIAEEDQTNLIFSCTENELYIFTYENGIFTTGEIKMSEFQITSPITCCYAFTCDYSSDETQNIDKKIITLTGHANGKVLVWENMQDKRELDDYKGTVIDITCSEVNVVIASNPSFLHFWDLKLRNKLKTIDIVSLRFKLFNFTIGSLLSAQDKIYLSTVEGDVAEITVKMKKEPKSIAKIQGSRLNHICRIRGAMNALTIIERPDDILVYVGGESEALCAFSSESHQLIHLAGVRQTITAIDALILEDGKKKVCVGTASGELQIRIESQGTLIGYKPSESRESYFCNGSILDAKFSPDGKFLFAVAEEDFMYLFTLRDELYFDTEDETTRKFVPLEGEIPISINFSDNSKTVLIGTNQRTHYTLDLSGPTDKLRHLHHFADRSDFSILNLRYSSLTGNYLSNLQPTSFWNTIKATVAADESGLIFHWKDRNEIVNNSGACLKGHSSQIARFALTKNQNIFFSLGSTDRTLIEWQIDNITTEEKKQHEELSGMKLAKIKTEIQQNALKKEISYSTFSDLVSNKLRDSFIFFDGTTDQRIDTIFYQNLLKPSSNHDNTRIPTISLKLHHVYGFLSSEKRNTLFYVHSHQASSHRRLVNPKNKKIQKLGSGKIEDFSDYLDKEPGLMHLPPHLQKQMLFSNEGIVPYDSKHDYCERYFIYFVSRIAIIYDPLTNTQRFYEGHRYRITALSVHPSKMIVATGESAPTPQIHIWKVSNLEPFKIIQSSHKNGIQMLRFSNDGSLLISISADTSFSLQVINWQTEETLAFQNTGMSKIFDVLFNPYNKHEFTIAGQRSIAVWELHGRSLARKSSIDLLFTESSIAGVEPIVTCVAYLNYHLGKDVDSDIILANDQGEIGVVTFGKYLTLRKNAHQGVINCLRITDMISKKLLIITSGEDEYLRIWDIAFNLIYEINARQIDLFQMQENKNFSIQSIDVYCCKSPSQNNYYKQKDKKEEKLNKPRILLGTRNGDIIEAIVTQNFSGIKSTSDTSQMLPSSRIGVTLASLQDIDNDSGNADSTNASINDWDLNSRSELEGSLSLNFVSYIKNHSGIAVNEKNSEYQQRVLFAVHPFSPVIYTIGENQDLYLWHIEHLKLLTVKNLEKVATVIRLSPNGDILAIGFTDGSVILLDAKLQEKSATTFIAPSLEMLQPIIIESLDPSPVLNIEFSRQEGLMAISYDNVQTKKLTKVGKFSKEGAHIAIYAPGLEELNIKNKIVMRLQYIKQLDIKPLTCLETDEGDSYLAGLAVYFMTFSMDEQFLLLYFQEIDQNMSRVNESSNGFYVIRDLYTNTSIEDYETIQGIFWERNNFPNHISAQYSFYTEEGKREFMNFARRPTMSVMTDYQSIASPEPISVVGSTNGDLYFFKSSALNPKKLSTPTQQYDFQPEEDQMYTSKSFAAHISFVNQIEIKDEFLFSAGAHDGCIMQWKLINEDSQWDADYSNFNSEGERETAMESTHYETFRSLSTEIFPLRNRISDVSKGIQNVEEPEIELELETVIGRKAFDRKNNLYYDFDERIIYSMGNLIIVHDPVTSEGTFNNEAGSLESFEEDNKKPKKKPVYAKQEFFKVDGEASTPTAPEISALALSTDRRFICAGTQEINASIYIWEVCSRTCIKSLKLNNCSIIQSIKFAYNSSHVCAIGISPDYTQIIFLIDALKGQVLGYINHVNSINEKIRDLIFFPNSIHQFLTCGVQHMSVWKYSGCTLNFSSCQIDVQESSSPVKLPLQEISGNKQNILNLFKRTSASAMNETQAAAQFKLTFTSICFVQNTPITGSADGDIYIWQTSGDNLKIMKKQSAHPKSAVLCLNSLTNTNVFVSGGEDGRVVIWQTFLIDKKFILEKIYEYSITTDTIMRAAMNPRNHVQSVFIGSKNILIGTKTGDIYELMKPKDIDIRWKKQSQTNLVVNKLKCNDHETPKALGFSHSMDKIYAITHNGRFCVWDLKSVDLIYSYEFARNTISMIAFKNKPLILVVFDTKVIMLNAEKGEDYQAIAGYEKEYKTQIVDVKISFNERYVAVALSSDDERSARINLYDLENRDGEMVTFLKREVKSVKFIDFSTDNSYLLYKAADGSDKSTIINIISKAEVDLNLVEFNVEWVSDGIQLSKFTKGVQSYYSLKYNGVSNSVIKMARIGEKTLAVTDEMGTIRLFRYPCEENSGIGYYKCYNEHMNAVNNFVLSVDRNYILTSSKIDKSIFLWKIKAHSNFSPHKIEPLA